MSPFSIKLSSVLVCAIVLVGCSSEPANDMPVGPIAYAFPDGPIAYGLPSCSSPPDSAVACSSDSACNDGNPCTTDACYDGVCGYAVADEGAACGQGATCDAEGCCDGL